MWLTKANIFWILWPISPWISYVCFSLRTLERKHKYRHIIYCIYYLIMFYEYDILHNLNLKSIITNKHLSYSFGIIYKLITRLLQISQRRATCNSVYTSAIICINLLIPLKTDWCVCAVLFKWEPFPEARRCNLCRYSHYSSGSVKNNLYLSYFALSTEVPSVMFTLYLLQGESIIPSLYHQTTNNVHC